MEINSSGMLEACAHNPQVFVVLQYLSDVLPWNNQPSFSVPPRVCIH